MPRNPIQRDPGLATPLIAKLRQFLDLTATEVADLKALALPARHALPREDLVIQGHASSAAVLVHAGWAIRQRTLPDGRRQILDFVIPGDLCDPSVFVTPVAEFSLTTVTRLTYTLIAGAAVLDLLASSPRLGAMLWWMEAQEGSLLRDHIVALGRLNAEERIAHLIWELWSRLKSVGLAVDDGFEWPATQEMIADETGLSVVHVNRTLRHLEKAGVIRRAAHVYHVRNPDRLRAIAQVVESPARARLRPDIEARLRRR